jgi:hypothetical protein
MSCSKRRAVREVTIFLGAYLTYFGVRAITQGDDSQALGNARAIIDFERSAGVAVEGAVQNAFLGSSVLVDAANAVYMYGHWPVIIASGVLLFRYRPEHYYRLRNAILVTGFAGLVIFALFPVAPPRLTDLPLVDTVTRGARGYRQMFPPALVNEYAAMPSFHAGWNVLIAVVVCQAVQQWWLRAAAVASASAMTIAVVATANHYVVDVAAGIGIVLVYILLLRALERGRGTPTLLSHELRRRAPRRQRPEAPEGGRRAGAAAG